jgi:hypothetical protein
MKVGGGVCTGTEAGVTAGGASTGAGVGVGVGVGVAEGLPWAAKGLNLESPVAEAPRGRSEGLSEGKGGGVYPFWEGRV